MRIGMGIALTLRNLLNGSSIAALFANDEPGVWSDPSDLDTLYQDTAGTSPVTTAGQTVARINDKSGNGNHATQATAAKRPTYGYHPFGGVRNLLVQTENFADAVWSKVEVSVTTNAAVAPDGTLTADKIIPTVVSGAHTVGQNVTIPTTATRTLYAKADGYNFVGMTFNNSTVRAAIFNLATGAINNVGSDVTATSMTDVGNGWWRLSMTVSNGGGFVRDYVLPTSSFAAWSGDGTSGIFFWGAQLGSTATDYQRVGNEFDVTEAGVPLVHYLRYDGTDDFMVTPTITPGTDKVQVFAGVRKLSDVSAGCVIETGTSSASIDGSFSVFAPLFSAQSEYAFDVRGTARNNRVFRGYPAPHTGVIYANMTTLAANATAAITVDINGASGTSPASAASSSSTGDFLAYPMYIGARAGSSLLFEGNQYQLVGRFGPNLDADTIAKVEAEVAGKTGIEI